MRSRTVRGYKSESGMLDGLMVTGSGVWLDLSWVERGNAPLLLSEFANQFWDRHKGMVDLTQLISPAII